MSSGFGVIPYIVIQFSRVKRWKSLITLYPTTVLQFMRNFLTIHLFYLDMEAICFTWTNGNAGTTRSKVRMIQLKKEMFQGHKHMANYLETSLCHLKFNADFCSKSLVTQSFSNRSSLYDCPSVFSKSRLSAQTANHARIFLMPMEESWHFSQLTTPYTIH